MSDFMYDTFLEYSNLTEKEYMKMCRFIRARQNEINRLNNSLGMKDRKIGELNVKITKTIMETKLVKQALYDEIKSLEKKIKDLELQLKDSNELNKKMKAQLKRDYTSSSKPSSMSPNHKKIANSREKTDRKPGAQKGYKHHPRKSFNATNRIQLPVPEIVKENPNKYTFEKEVKKTLVDIKITVDVKEFIGGKYRLNGTNKYVVTKFPESVKDEMNYGCSIKALACLLNNYCNVSIRKTKEIIEGMTGGEIRISTGKISSLVKEFSRNTKEERGKEFNQLFYSKYLHTDATFVRVNGKTNYVYVTANEDYVHYQLKEHKGFNGISDTPVEGYEGVLIHDHDKTLFNYGNAHQKCLAHELRYIQDSINNEAKLTWNKKMKLFLQETIHKFKNNLDLDYTEISKRYDEIISIGNNEYKNNIPYKYYRDGYNTWKRLRDYKESVLYFITHPDIPYTNNLVERLARQIKRKSKQVGAFRSFEHTQEYCDFMSIVETGKSNNKNIYELVNEYF